MKCCEEYSVSGGGGKREKLMKRINEIPPAKRGDLSDPKVYSRFCISYGESIAPELREIDLWQARSLGYAMTTVVR